MRIAAEIVLDRTQESPMGEPTMIAEQVGTEFLPAAGTRVQIELEEGGTSEYVVTSSRAWVEDQTLGMGDGEMSANDPQRGAHRTMTQHSDR